MRPRRHSRPAIRTGLVSGATSQAVTGLTGGVTYYFRVAAAGGSCEGAWSPTGSATPSGTPTPPSFTSAALVRRDDRRGPDVRRDGLGLSETGFDAAGHDGLRRPWVRCGHGRVDLYPARSGRGLATFTFRATNDSGSVTQIVTAAVAAGVPSAPVRSGPARRTRGLHGQLERVGVGDGLPARRQHRADVPGLERRQRPNGPGQQRGHGCVLDRRRLVRNRAGRHQRLCPDAPGVLGNRLAGLLDGRLHQPDGRFLGADLRRRHRLQYRGLHLHQQRRVLGRAGRRECRPTVPLGWPCRR
jgi:hypothetical protein